jgi:hypothetical protein
MGTFMDPENSNVYLFIVVSFSDTLINSDYIASNDRMIDE